MKCVLLYLAICVVISITSAIYNKFHTYTEEELKSLAEWDDRVNNIDMDYMP